MLVYGDPKFSQSLKSLLAAFHKRLENAKLDSLDNLRTLLIQAGQLEQAVADYAMDHAVSGQLLSALAHLIDHVAAEFAGSWKGQGYRAEPRRIAEAFANVNRALAKNLTVTIKVPEGFAFYALFPEQYCATALTWAAQHSNCGEILVVGVRSIGTSLSAVVKEILAGAGLKVQRLTVRPTGHPFDRKIELDIPPPANTKHVLVVDEGPGISGSSMAAVAEALDAARLRDISFLPGHNGAPGPSATPAIRARWNRTPRYVTSIADVKWNSHSLEQSLTDKARELCGGGPFESIQDLSIGRWRKFAFQNEHEWPATAIQFERMKFLCTRRDGISVLWKFAGLHCTEDGHSAAEATFKKLSSHADAGFSPAPLGVHLGFVATRWVEGTRLTRADLRDPSVLSRIGAYLVHAAGPALSASEHESAISRLAEMLYWNTKEALGDSLAESTRLFAEDAKKDKTTCSYGDGHLSPHEWIRCADGIILKTDCEGHAHDHTIVGPQSLLWDVAGALVEWDLSLRVATPLLSVIEQGGAPIDFEALTYYLLAYSAFRVGLLSLSLNQTSDAAEKNRLSLARNFYREKLEQWLTTEAAPAQILH
jgi:hypothetical protein